ncbi:hypothetical protein [Microbulbifer sp.]|uniref:hypothetical protein n=1 Tax=Microbulbifer sp. TaxID=1908541 RepID=UPI003F320CB7
MSIRPIPTAPRADKAPKVEIINGRRVKVVNHEQAKEIGKSVIAEYRESLEILKDR